MKALLIEDHAGFAVIVREMLHSMKEAPISFEWTSRLDKGIELITKWMPDVILLDLSLPDSYGLDTLSQIRQHAATAPIIVLTGNDNEKLAIEAISQGAQDYLVKGDIDRRGFRRAVRYAIERKKTELRLEYHRQKQTVLHEINLAITSTLDFQSVLRALLEKMGKLLPEFAVTFWIPLNDRGEWESFVCWNLEKKNWRPFWQGPASGLVQSVLAARTPIIIEDVANDPRASNPEMLRRNKLVSYLGVPLRFKDELLGIIGFFSREGGQFNSEEVEFLTTLAGQAAVAVYNSRTYERAQAQAISLEQANEELRATQRKHAELIETVNAIVWEADPITWQFTFVSKAAEEILGYPIETWLHTPDFWANHLLHPDDREAAINKCRTGIANGDDHELEYRAVAADGRAVWLHDTVRVITDETGKPIRLRGVMIDITKSREAEEKLQKHSLEIQSLQEVSQRVLNSGDVRDAIEKILDMAVELGGYDIGSIRLLSPANGYNHVILRGYHDPESMRAILNHRVARPRDERWRNQAQVISTRKTHVFEDIEIHEGFPVFKREGVRSVILVPIAMNDEAIGVLQVGNRRMTKFQPDQVKLLETLASQIGIVLQKAKLYEEIRTHLAHIQSMRQIEQAMVSTLSLDDVLRVLLDKIESVFSFKVVIAAQLLKPNSWEFGTIVCRNIDPDLWRREHERHLPINQSGLVREVLNSSTSVQILRLEDDPRVRHREFKRVYGLVSYLGIPLRVAEQPVGVLDIITTTEHEFSEQEVNYLTSLSSHAAIAIQNAGLYAELGKQSQELSALFAVTSAASQSLEMESILQEVIRKITEIFGFDATRVFLFDDQGEMLHAQASYLTRSDISLATPSFKKGQGIVGTVGANGEAIIISNVETDPRYAELSSSKNARSTQRKFLAGFPIKYKAATLGVIMCMGKNARELTAHEIQLIDSMSGQIAIAIHNARLYAEVEKQSKELSALFDVTATASQSLEMDQILQQVIRKITEIFGFDAMRVCLFDDQRETLHSRATYQTHAHFSMISRDFKKGQGITGTVATTGEAVIISNVETDPRYEKLSHTKTALRDQQKFLASFPIKYKDDILGVITCVGHQPRQLAAHEIQLITSMSNQIAIAIHNARLYAEVEKKTRELSALFDVTATASRSLNMERFLQEVVRKITEIFGFDAMRVSLFDEHRETLHARAIYQTHPEFAALFRDFEKGQGITGTVGVSGEAIIISNVETDPRYEELSDTKLALKSGHNFLAGFPIKYNDETLGVITCMGRQARELAADEIQLITSMSNQVAVAIHNARLYAEIEKKTLELSALFDVTAAASESLETDHILREVTQKITEIFAFDATIAFLLDDAKVELHAQATYETHPNCAPGTTRLKIGQGISGAVVATGAAIIISDTSTDPRYLELTTTKWALKTQQKFLASFPIKYQDEVLGAITCVGRHTRQLADHEIQLINSMSSQIAVALENSRYYEQTRKQATQLRNYAVRQESVREMERTRISREIHDELGQALTALKLEVSLLRTKLRGDSDLKQRIREVSEMLDGTIQTVRKIATQLRPDVLDKLGLIPAIEWHLQEFRKRTGIKSDFASRPSELHLTEPQSTAFFRILQEALTNVTRHARASRVRIRLVHRDGQTYLLVEDNGVGIDAEKIIDPDSLGLLGMQERARALGGRVIVRRSRRSGTLVTACIPANGDKHQTDLSAGIGAI